MSSYDGQTQTIACGIHAVHIECIDSQGDEVNYAIAIDGASVASFTILRYYRLEVSCKDNEVALWGGSRICFVDMASRQLKRFDRDDEVHAVYPFRTLWCIRGEISVSLFDSLAGLDRSRVDYDEVILESRLEGTYLHLRDLRGRTFTVSLADNLRTSLQ